MRNDGSGEAGHASQASRVALKSPGSAAPLRVHDAHKKDHAGSH